MAGGAPPDAWDPTQYERFRAERKKPFLDLLASIDPRPSMRIVDLGCGTGDLTRELHGRLAARETLGIDRSAAMLARAVPAPGLRFELGDAAGVAGSWDLVFSNSALHWVPDHAALFARLERALAPGGQLAVQMPSNFGHPSHRVAASVAREEPFRSALSGWEREVPVLAPEAYAALLHRLGFSEQSVRLQVYGHLLPRREDVVEWVKGTLLTDYQARLPPASWPRFLERYREALLPLLEDQEPFFYAYPRLLIWGRKK